MIHEPVPPDPVVLGTLRLCPVCDDEWPDDEEFYAPGAAECRACAYDRAAERRRRNAAAVRRHYARRRGIEA